MSHLGYLNILNLAIIILINLEANVFNICLINLTGADAPPNGAGEKYEQLAFADK